jgi:ABC-type nitrate/sulfonate/bicarbonate transport system substrate-binding protein
LIRRILIAAALVALLSVTPGALGAGNDFPTLTVAFIPDVGYSAYFVAKWEGLFKKYKVNVNLVSASSSLMPSEVVSGQIDIGSTSPGAALAVAEQGMPVSMVYTIGQNLGFALVSNPSITSVAQLKATNGCRIATGSPGALSYGWYLEYKNKLGLDNCSPLSLSGPSTQIAALASGSVQAGVFAMGTATTAATAPPNGAGAHILVDPTANGWQAAYAGVQPYPVPTLAASLWGLKSNLDAKRSAVVSLVAALDEATRLMTPANWPKVARWIQLGDPANFGTQSIDTIVQGLQGEGPWIGMNSVILPAVKPGQKQKDPNTLVGYISPSTWGSSLASLQAIGLANFSPADAAVQYPVVVDMSYWRQAYRQYLRKKP